MRALMNILLAFSLLIPLVLPAQEKKASIGLDRTEIKLGEQINARIEVRFPVTESFQFAEIGDTITSFIEVVEISKIDTTYEGNNLEIKVLSANLTLTSFDSGYHPLPPILFYSDKDSLATEPNLIHVQDVEVDMPAPQPGQQQPEIAIKDIKDIRDVDFSIWEWIKMNALWIILSIVLIAGIWAFFKYIYPRLKEKKITVIPQKKADPPHKIALDKLEKLRNQKLWQSGKVKEFHSALSEITREYIEHRFRLPALESTSGEIIVSMRSERFDEKQIDELRQLLELSDLAKFAKFIPLGDENERVFVIAKNFIVSTSPIEEEASEKEKEEVKHV